MHLPITSGGGGTGKATFTDLEVTKDINELSPSFATSLALGEHVERVTVQIYEPGTTRAAITYRLEDVLVADMSISPGGNETETVAFFYDMIRWKVGDEVFCFEPALSQTC